MEECSFPKARPISCKVCPAFQRRHTSSFCSVESPNRLPCFINTTLKTALYQMVLHRPSEPAALIRHVDYFRVACHPPRTSGLLVTITDCLVSQLRDEHDIGHTRWRFASRHFP